MPLLARALYHVQSWNECRRLQIQQLHEQRAYMWCVKTTVCLPQLHQIVRSQYSVTGFWVNVRSVTSYQATAVPRRTLQARGAGRCDKNPHCPRLMQRPQGLLQESREGQLFTLTARMAGIGE